MNHLFKEVIENLTLQIKFTDSYSIAGVIIIFPQDVLYKEYFSKPTDFVEEATP